MKTRALILILILILTVLIFSESCATSKKAYVSSEYVLKELTGTWYNEEYENPTITAWPKYIVRSDGSFEECKEFSGSTEPNCRPGKYISIDKAWTDLKGNIWYEAKYKFDWMDQEFCYEIGKISNEGKVVESVWSFIELPTEVDSENINYEIYYRQ
jgi:hypothetical protein